MDYVKQIREFRPGNNQEAQDKKVILDYIQQFDNILVRENEFAHITSSGFIMNPKLDKVLLVHHNIRDTWAWTGGHVDDNPDFLQVAIDEAREETGIRKVTPLTEEIVSLDILPVYGHVKNGQYVSGHQHLSVAYILIAHEDQELFVNEDENSGVAWFSVDQFTPANFDTKDIYLYGKLIEKARQIGTD